MKKIVCLLLAAAMLVALTGCRLIENIGEVINGVIEHEAGFTHAPSAEPTGPAESPFGIPDTPPPTAEPHEATEADAEFEAIDREFFASYITGDALSFNLALSGDPNEFGIDPEDVEPGWGDLSLESHKAAISDCRELIVRLQNIDRSALSERNQIGYDSFMRGLEVTVLYDDYYYYDEPLTPLNGLHTMLPLYMLFFNVRTVEDVEKYLFLVEDIERYLGQVAQFEVEKAGEGLFMTEVALDQVVESCRIYASMGEDSTFISCFERIEEQARAAGMSEQDIKLAARRNRIAVLERVLPAYSSLADTLESLRSKCSPFVGAAERSEKEKDYFELAARDEGATMDSMDRVVELLEQMGHNTYMSMYNAIIWGPDDIYDRYDAGEPITFGSVENNLEWLESFAKKYYPELPEYELECIEVPEDIAEDFSPAAYLDPPYDDYRHNLMMINPSSEGADDLLTIAHETIPGHMLQFLITRNTPGMSLTQQATEPTGYAEGWTVFTESFVAANCDEVGSEYCVMVNSESTFCNVFMPAYVSIMVNSEGWSMDEVEEFLSEYGLEDAADIFYEYAVTMPLYAMSYAIGYAYMAAIYEKADPVTPEQHKAFFEKYLSFGPCYMDMMMDYMSK